MTFPIEGKVKIVSPVEKISDNYSKKELILIVDEQSDYPQIVPVYAANKKIDLIRNIQVGDILKAHVNLKGKEKNDKYFISLEIWKIDN